jgi:hypothetical protein
VTFGPGAHSAWVYAKSSGSSAGLPGGFVSLLTGVLVFGATLLVCYLTVRRFSGPVSVWLAFFAAGIPTGVMAVMFLPSQFTTLAKSSSWLAAVVVALSAGVAWPLLALPALLGVWLATPALPVSDPSGTLPEEVEDRW